MMLGGNALGSHTESGINGNGPNSTINGFQRNSWMSLDARPKIIHWIHVNVEQYSALVSLFYKLQEFVRSEKE